MTWHMEEGANVLYMSKRFPSSKILGIDYDKDFLALKHIGRDNASIEYGNWFDMDPKYIGKFDGIVSFQTLLVLKDYKNALRALAELEPKWIALTTLFYEGKINFYTVVDGHERNDEGWGEDGKRYYNVYSLPLVKEFLNRCFYQYEGGARLATENDQSPHH